MVSQEIVNEAWKELHAEDRRAAIESIKATLLKRRKRPLWKRLFPYTITITRND